MCANGMHEGSDCPGFGPGCDDDDSVRCSGCDEPLRACACEEQTVETAALDVPAVSEAEQVRRQFRDELVELLGRADRAQQFAERAGVGQAAAAGTMDGGITALLVRFCGMSEADVVAGRMAARRAEAVAAEMGGAR